MSLFDSVANLAGNAIGSMIGGPLGGMIGGKIGDFVGDIVELFAGEARNAVQSSDLPDQAKGIFNAAYGLAFE